VINGLRVVGLIPARGNKLESSTKKCAISVTEIDNKILKIFFKIAGNLVPISKSRYLNINRQTLLKIFMSNGVAYLFRKSDFLKLRKYFTIPWSQSSELN
jgi:CMP-N-acetylneuraminic acid synthetase